MLNYIHRLLVNEDGYIAKWRKFKVGDGLARAGMVGMLDVSAFTVAGTGSTLAAENVLASRKIPLNTLYKANIGLQIKAFGAFAANGNNKEIKLNLHTSNATGGKNLLDTGALTDNNKKWFLDGVLWKPSANVQMFSGVFIHDTTVLTIPVVTNGAQVDTVDQYLNLTGIAATADNDIVCYGMAVLALTL